MLLTTLISFLFLIVDNLELDITRLSVDEESLITHHSSTPVLLHKSQASIQHNDKIVVLS